MSTQAPQETLEEKPPVSLPDTSTLADKEGRSIRLTVTDRAKKDDFAFDVDRLDEK